MLAARLSGWQLLIFLLMYLLVYLLMYLLVYLLLSFVSEPAIGFPAHRRSSSCSSRSMRWTIGSSALRAPSRRSLASTPLREYPIAAGSRHQGDSSLKLCHCLFVEVVSAVILHPYWHLSRLPAISLFSRLPATSLLSRLPAMQPPRPHQHCG